MTAQADELLKYFGLKTPPLMPNISIFRPTDQALVITTNDNHEGEARLLGWGLRVKWDKQPIINARVETVSQKKTFQPLLQARCLVPVTAYFEWRQSGRAKLKNRITLKDSPVFAFAGLSDGENFTIITCPPSPAIAHIHDRMPVILGGDSLTPWIDPGLSFGDVENCLTPYKEFPLNADEETPGAPRQPDLFG